MFTFLSQNSRVHSHQTQEVQIQSKARLFNQTGVFIIVFYCSTNFCFNHNVVFVITFYFCSCLFIALVARNILTLKLLCSFEDVTEFAHHLIRRQKHSTMSLVSSHTSFALQPLPACFNLQLKTEHIHDFFLCYIFLVTPLSNYCYELLDKCA